MQDIFPLAGLGRKVAAVQAGKENSANILPCFKAKRGSLHHFGMTGYLVGLSAKCKCRQDSLLKIKELKMVTPQNWRQHEALLRAGLCVTAQATRHEASPGWGTQVQKDFPLTWKLICPGFLTSVHEDREVCTLPEKATSVQTGSWLVAAEEHSQSSSSFLGSVNQMLRPWGHWQRPVSGKAVKAKSIHLSQDARQVLGAAGERAEGNTVFSTLGGGAGAGNNRCLLLRGMTQQTTSLHRPQLQGSLSATGRRNGNPTSAAKAQRPCLKLRLNWDNRASHLLLPWAQHRVRRKSSLQTGKLKSREKGLSPTQGCRDKAKQARGKPRNPHSILTTRQQQPAHH